MKEFIINLGWWIALLVPIYGTMLALACIAEGDGKGFTVFIIATLIASIIIYRKLRK